MSSSIEVITGSRPGAQGFPGYAPVVATVADGTRIVLKVIDWTGGVGPKPAINQYIASTGLTANIAAATDVRGSGAGDTGDNVILSGGTYILAKNHSCYLVDQDSLGHNVLTIPAVVKISGFECRAIVKTNGALQLAATGPNVNVYFPTSRSIGSAFENINFVHAYSYPFSISMNKGTYEIRCFKDATTTHIYVF